MKQVILMRTDLGISTGKMVAQAVHAGSLIPGDGCAVIALKVESKEQMMGLADKASYAHLKVGCVSDAGHTEVPPGTLTCCIIGPAEDKAIDKITGALPLL
jgi:peptidyl-tRNA hydrolase, PTH2 family